METKTLKVNPGQADIFLLQEAANIIKSGGLVAFPTETVYGLGADAFNPLACAKIFDAKNRPLNDPLIVHIADKEDIYKAAGEIYKRALDLIDEFWPGPLTLVLKKSQNIPDIVTAGLNTVAVRMPNNEIALSFIKGTQTLIAAPSANLFSRPSPATAQHVYDDLRGRIDLILDGGRTQVGIESTILDLTQTPFRILRPGGIDIENLRKIIPDIEPYQGKGILSPGMFKRHYSPKAKVIVVEDCDKTQCERVKDIASEFLLQGYSVGIMAKAENKNRYNGEFNLKIIGPEENLTLCASCLYSVLREFDKDGTQIIIAESVKEEGLGVAIMDRLRKAAAKEIHV